MAGDEQKNPPIDLVDMLNKFGTLMVDQAANCTKMMITIVDLDHRLRELERKFSHVDIFHTGKN